jgi:hypothetical protein
MARIAVTLIEVIDWLSFVLRNSSYPQLRRESRVPLKLYFDLLEQIINGRLDT